MNQGRVISEAEINEYVASLKEEIIEIVRGPRGRRKVVLTMDEVQRRCQSHQLLRFCFARASLELITSKSLVHVPLGKPHRWGNMKYPKITKWGLQLPDDLRT